MIKKKKILFLIQNLGGGGAEKVLVNLLNKLDSSRFDLTLRTLVRGGNNLSRLNPYIHYEYIFPFSFPGLGKLDRLPHQLIYKLVAHGDFDVIVVYLHGVLTRIVSYAPKCQRTVAYLHANMEKSPFMLDLRQRHKVDDIFQSYDKIIAVSNDIRDSFIRMGGPQNNLQVIYNTFDVDEIIRMSKEKIDHQPPDNMIRLCSIGKLEQVKGFDRLLECIHRLKAHGFPNVHLTIIGEGNQRAILEQYISSHELNRNVKLAGFDSNPYKYLRNSALLVCSSYSEGFSSVVAESIILGVPVLTTDCAGMREILGAENQYGLIVPNDADSLYSGLCRLLTFPGMLRDYQSKARQRSSFFSPESRVKDVEDLLLSL